MTLVELVRRAIFDLHLGDLGHGSGLPSRCPICRPALDACRREDPVTLLPLSAFVR